nr:hypothetical protein [Klebsiella pneumoniae]
MIKRNLPLMITLAVFVLGYLYCLTQPFQRGSDHVPPRPSLA